MTVYSHRRDPQGVLKVIRQLAPDAMVERDGEAWSSATIRTAAGLLTIFHSRDYYAGPNWPRQMQGMLNYFGQAPIVAEDRVLELITSFRFALGCVGEPHLDPADEDDPRVAIVYGIAAHLDGVIFVPARLLDASGRALVSLDGENDEEAKFPEIPTADDDTGNDEASDEGIDDGGIDLAALGDDLGGRADEEDPEAPEFDEARAAGDAHPPSPERIARRACALAAVTGRALLEQEDFKQDPGIEETRRAILLWVEEIGIGEELEPDEWKVLQLPLGRLPGQDLINATWRLEGLGVLAWALNRFEVPPHDELVNPGKLLPSVGILRGDRAMALLAEPALRPMEDLERMSGRLLGIHWRLRDWSIRPEKMDFLAFSKECWFGSFDITGIRLIDNELAIGENSIDKAHKDLVSAAHSAALERHLAINWILGDSEVYSDTDTST